MEKSQLRKLLLARRAAVSDRARKDAAIAEKASALAKTYAAVFSYVSMGSEVDTRALLNELRRSGHTLYIPHACPSGEMHAVPLPATWDAAQDKLGNIPLDSSEICDGYADLIFVPLVGFSPKMWRIGYGKGYYDRHFTQNPHGYKVGLAYDEQICEFVPSATDVPLDCIITPTRIVKEI